MIPVIIGISLGLFIILFITLLRQFDKKLIYGLALTAIGFLYVGFTWTDRLSLIITCFQAIFFLFLSYYGIRKNISLLAAGYFLHGLWDLAYHSFRLPDLVPPQYDLFCLSIDFTFGAYLLYMNSRLKKNNKEQKNITASF